MLKVILVTFFLTATTAFGLNNDSLFNQTIRLLEKNSTFIIENPSASMEISKNVNEIIFSNNSDASLIQSLDLFYLTFIHHHYSFDIVSNGIILKFTEKDFEQKENYRDLLVYILPSIYIRRNKQDLITKWKSIKVSNEIILYFRKTLSPNYINFYYEMNNWLSEKSSILGLRKLISKYLLSDLNSKYLNFEKYPVSLSPLKMQIHD